MVEHRTRSQIRGSWVQLPSGTQIFSESTFSPRIYIIISCCCYFSVRKLIYIYNHCHIVGTRTPYLSRPPAPTHSMLLTNRKRANLQGVRTNCAFQHWMGERGCVGQRLVTVIVNAMLSILIWVEGLHVYLYLPRWQRWHSMIMKQKYISYSPPGAVSTPSFGK